MKNTLFVVPMMTIAMLTIGVAQQSHDHGKKAESKDDQMEHCGDTMAEMGKPAFEGTVEGVQVQVWLMTQEEHKKMMAERIKDSTHSMDHMKMTDDMEEHDHAMNQSHEGHRMGDMHSMVHDRKDSSGGKSSMHDMMHCGMMHKMTKLDEKKSDDHTADAGTKANEGMDHARMKEAMMAGTHHVMVRLDGDACCPAGADTKVTLTVVSPSRKTMTLELSAMKNHFGGGISLDEHGKYQLTVAFEGGETKGATTFENEVK